MGADGDQNVAGADALAGFFEPHGVLVLDDSRLFTISTPAFSRFVR
jgi:hypothetical protein